MGEWSKTVGEFGEETVDKFLNLTGWNNPPKGITLTCIKNNDHSLSKENDRKTHGIDFLYTYMCPLVDGTLKNAIIQVKYNSDSYPNNPSTKFKNYLKELAYSLECFKKSDIKSQYTKSFSGFDKVEDIGVLIWLSHNNSNENYDDLISRIENVQFSEQLNYHSIYIVDNKRLGFIYELLTFTKNKYVNSHIEFVYPDTGKNINPIIKKNSGNILPLQYINASIIPLKIQSINNKDEVILALFCIDPFSMEDLNRLVGLGQSLSHNWSSKIIIAFPNYDKLFHENDVRNVFMTFLDTSFIEKISVISFRPNFRNI